MFKIYEWLNEDKARYYRIVLIKNGEQTKLTYKWGSCISNRGGIKSILVDSDKEAQLHIEKMIKRRKSRGYNLIAPKIH